MLPSGPHPWPPLFQFTEGISWMLLCMKNSLSLRRIRTSSAWVRCRPCKCGIPCLARCHPAPLDQRLIWKMAKALSSACLVSPSEPIGIFCHHGRTAFWRHTSRIIGNCPGDPWHRLDGHTTWSLGFLRGQVPPQTWGRWIHHQKAR